MRTELWEGVNSLSCTHKEIGQCFETNKWSLLTVPLQPMSHPHLSIYTPPPGFRILLPSQLQTLRVTGMSHHTQKGPQVLRKAHQPEVYSLKSAETDNWCWAVVCCKTLYHGRGRNIYLTLKKVLTASHMITTLSLVVQSTSKELLKWCRLVVFHVGHTHCVVCLKSKINQQQNHGVYRAVSEQGVRGQP